MKRTASILTGLSLAVLFFVVPANAQSDAHRMTANIPFEFTVGNVSLPAGQYEFLRTGAGANIIVVRDADGHTRFTVPTASIQGNGFPAKSELKFETVDGRHVLVQIWNESADNGAEFTYGRTAEELAGSGTVTER